jgi:AcrR family transcriptional regulator
MAAQAKRQTAGAPAKPRRTQEERSQETRAKLLNAAAELLREQGYAQLTTEAVSSRAGVTNGARAYHYASKLDLIVATADYIHRANMAIGYDMLAKSVIDGDPVEAYVEFCSTLYFDPNFVAFNEVSSAARTDPVLLARLQPMVTEYRQLIEHAWVDAIVRAGNARDWAKAMVMITFHMFRSMGTNPLWPDARETNRDAVAMWHRLITADRAAGTEPAGARGSVAPLARGRRGRQPRT